ncbi:MAG: MATE family efflux transporter [Lachnospiraceae bacterium]|nr:MATE family efflux transporter [Lachnospiraceae bacterium]
MENSTTRNKLRIKDLIGGKDFYKKVLLIAVPIMLQNGITNFVGMLDNIMVGRVGTEQMSGVSIVNQLLFIVMLCLFGATSGAGVLGAQYYGKGDYEGVRNTFRIKLVISAVILIATVIVLLIFGDNLISMFLHEGSESGDLEATLRYGRDYLKVMLIGQIPLAVEFSYSSTLRESGETSLPMKASIAAVFVNLVLNYILIFGKFGAPELGVVGAAAATVVSRCVQLTIVAGYSHTHLEKNPYFEGTYKTLKVPGALLGKVIVLALPLMLNETLWSLGVTTQNACLSTRGLAVVAGMNICVTICNVFNIIFIALGDAVAIMVGQQFGAGEVQEGKLTAYRIIAFSTTLTIFISTVMFLVGPLFPRIYKTYDEVKELAGHMIRIAAIFMPLQAYLHSTYFALRSGGKTFITFLFDSGFMWIFGVPISFLLAKYSPFGITTVYFLVLSTDIIKIIIGTLLLRTGLWARSLVDS